MQNLTQELNVLRTASTAKFDSTAVSKSAREVTFKSFIKKSGGWLVRNALVMLALLLLLAVCYIIGDSVHKKRKEA